MQGDIYLFINTQYYFCFSFFRCPYLICLYRKILREIYHFILFVKLTLLKIKHNYYDNEALGLYVYV